MVGYQTSNRTRYCQIMAQPLVMLQPEVLLKIGQPPKLKPKVKHPAKVHEWDGISPRGVTPMVLFIGTMTSINYSRKSLPQTSVIRAPKIMIIIEILLCVKWKVICFVCECGVTCRNRRLFITYSKCRIAVKGGAHMHFIDSLDSLDIHTSTN